VLHVLSDDQNPETTGQALLVLAALTIAEKRRSVNFWTGDKSWAMDED
jgi:hypothetical protein